MKAGNKSPTMEYVVDQLRKNPDLDYAAIRAGAEERGLKIYPIVYGRAQALLGLVKVTPRGTKKKIAPRSSPRGRGRPRGATTLDSLQSVIDDMKALAAERDRYRRALDKIAEVLDEALD